MVVLDRAGVEAADADGHPWGGAVKLALAQRSLSDVGVLAQCPQLQRLDLAHNSITSVQVTPHKELCGSATGQSGPPHCC